MNITVTNIIDRLGGPTPVARAIGTTQQNVSNMRRENRIPAHFWRSIISLASERGEAGIDEALLMRIAEQRVKTRRSVA